MSGEEEPVCLPEEEKREKTRPKRGEDVKRDNLSPAFILFFFPLPFFFCGILESDLFKTGRFGRL